MTHGVRAFIAVPDGLAEDPGAQQAGTTVQIMQQREQFSARPRRDGIFIRHRYAASQMGLHCQQPSDSVRASMSHACRSCHGMSVTAGIAPEFRLGFPGTPHH